MLEDVRAIIAEQLGKDLTKVGSPCTSLRACRAPHAEANHCRLQSAAGSSVDPSSWAPHCACGA